MLVSLFITSADTYGEHRLDNDLTVGQLKDKLVPVTGISQHYQVLRVFRNREAADKGEAPTAMLDDNASLASYGIQDWSCIKVDNTDPNARPGEFSDVTGVDKFELTEEEYAAKKDTVRAYLQANKLGQYADVPQSLVCEPPPPSSAPADIVPGARAEVPSEGGGIARRGTVRFVGEAAIGKGGVWVGVELDEPLGKGDGSVDGKRYFTSLAKHAAFVRPDKVTIGDFPEEDLMADDDDEI